MKQDTAHTIRLCDVYAQTLKNFPVNYYVPSHKQPAIEATIAEFIDFYKHQKTNLHKETDVFKYAEKASTLRQSCHRLTEGIVKMIVSASKK